MGVPIALGQLFHWGFARLRSARVAFSLLHNLRNASKTTDLRVMSGAMEARVIDKMLDRSPRRSVPNFRDISCGGWVMGVDYEVLGLQVTVATV
jgi:hypothetical protein